MENFYSAKDIVKKIKKYSTDWYKLITKDIFDKKDCISYKELKLTIRKQPMWILKWQKILQTPHQGSWLENPRDGGAWWAAIYGVAQSWTWLKQLSSSTKKDIQMTKNHKKRYML